jgi:hypothetical protein
VEVVTSTDPASLSPASRRLALDVLASTVNVSRANTIALTAGATQVEGPVSLCRSLAGQ